jgi:hypothetical protein
MTFINLSPVTRLLPLALCIVGTCSPVSGQLPGQVKDVQDQLKAIEERMEDARRNTNRFLTERRIREGPCANLYEFPSSETYLMPADVFRMIDELRQRFGRLAITLQPVADIEGELAKRRSQLQTVQDQLGTKKEEKAEIEQEVEQARTLYWQRRKELKEIELRQINAIRVWLLERYGDKMVQMRPEGSQIVITTTLFGTFITDYPGAMPPDAPAEVRVLFAPSVLTTDIWPNDISVGALGYSSGIVDYIKLATTFERDHFTSVRPGEPVTWTWIMQSPKDFKGVSFKIKMGVRRDAEKQQGPDIVTAELPIDIVALPGEWSRSWVLFSGLFSGAFIVEVLRLSGGWLRRKIQEKRERKIFIAR